MSMRGVFVSVRCGGLTLSAGGDLPVWHKERAVEYQLQDTELQLIR